MRTPDDDAGHCCHRDHHLAIPLAIAEEEIQHFSTESYLIADITRIPLQFVQFYAAYSRITNIQ